MRDRHSAKTILLLASNPSNTARMRLDEEAREIAVGLRMGTHRDQFVLQQQWALRPDDIRRTLLTFNPQIVHFCGHGEGVDGLAVENETGQMQLVPTAALADFFALFADRLECVLLNACYSEVQAAAISQHIDYVIGMSQAIGDRAAIKFAIGFYDALGAGRSYEDAYKFGCNAIAMHQIPQDIIPKIKKKRNPNPPPPRGYDQRPQTRFSPASPAIAAPLPSRDPSSNRRPVPPKTPKRSSQRPHRVTVLSTAKQVWFFLLPIIAVWSIVGLWQYGALYAARGDQAIYSLIGLGALGGLLSGLLFSLARRVVIPERHWLPTLFLQMLVGIVSGSLLWALVGSLISTQNDGLITGTFFGVIVVSITLYSLNRKRAKF